MDVIKIVSAIIYAVIFAIGYKVTIAITKNIYSKDIHISEWCLATIGFVSGILCFDNFNEFLTIMRSL